MARSCLKVLPIQLLMQVLVLSLLSSAGYADCHLNVRVNQAPPQYMQENGKWVGRAVELMESLLDEAGCEKTYVSMPWQRAILELQKGSIDAMMNVGFNEERSTFFHFISPHTYESQVLVVRKDLNVQVNSLDDVKRLPLLVGYEKGNIFDEVFTQKFEADSDFRDKFVGLPNADLYKMVYLGRWSAALSISENAIYAFNKNPDFARELKVLPLSVSRLPTYFAFSKASISPEKLLQLHEANVRAIAKGRYQRVIKKWDHRDRR